jgi:hypothetical protein
MNSPDILSLSINKPYTITCLRLLGVSACGRPSSPTPSDPPCFERPHERHRFARPSLPEPCSLLCLGLIRPPFSRHPSSC